MTVSLDQLEGFITRLGYPAAVTVCILYALWRCGGFLGREAVIPLVGACRELLKMAIEFVQHLQVCQGRQADAIETMCGQITEVAKMQKRHGELLVDLSRVHGSG